ncbi:MAG: hypothetical protein IIC03_11745 [Proteobacteria bacterium]|nr:hypothetical protein [Pseudomonadota bacterium]
MSVTKAALDNALAAIFVSAEQGLSDPSPEAVAAYLEGVSAEARLFEELLEDG